MTLKEIRPQLEKALAFRSEQGYLRPPFDSACRLLNGFTEGVPDLAIDLFARTVVIHHYGKDGGSRFVSAGEQNNLACFLTETLPFVKAVIWKERASTDPILRNGVLILGSKPDSRIREHTVRYAIDLQLNQDNSFYADTRLLRQWLLQKMKEKSVLNTFSYTGSLGTAAAAGGAKWVLQTDISEHFTEMAKRSFTLNRIYFNRRNFITGNFFLVISRLKREGSLFDCVILDPPFFSYSAKGSVNLATDPVGLVRKVRPLVADHGFLILVNNSLYLSGEDFLKSIHAICDDQYLQFREMIPVPSDFTGVDPDYLKLYPANPAPFNHPTKIAILSVRRKDARPSTF